jgi:hypothetical protein
MKGRTVRSGTSGVKVGVGVWVRVGVWVARYCDKKPSRGAVERIQRVHALIRLGLGTLLEKRIDFND